MNCDEHYLYGFHALEVVELTWNIVRVGMMDKEYYLEGFENN